MQNTEVREKICCNALRNTSRIDATGQYRVINKIRTKNLEHHELKDTLVQYFVAHIVRCCNHKEFLEELIRDKGDIIAFLKSRPPYVLVVKIAFLLSELNSEKIGPGYEELYRALFRCIPLLRISMVNDLYLGVYRPPDKREFSLYPDLCDHTKRLFSRGVTIREIKDFIHCFATMDNFSSMVGIPSLFLFFSVSALKNMNSERIPANVVTLLENITGGYSSLIKENIHEGSSAEFLLTIPIHNMHREDQVLLSNNQRSGTRCAVYTSACIGTPNQELRNTRLADPDYIIRTLPQLEDMLKTSITQRELGNILDMCAHNKIYILSLIHI